MDAGLHARGRTCSSSNGPWVEPGAMSRGDLRGKAHVSEDGAWRWAGMVPTGRSVMQMLLHTSHVVTCEVQHGLLPSVRLTLHAIASNLLQLWQPRTATGEGRK